jgi:hypothetical protein
MWTFSLSSALLPRTHARYHDISTFAFASLIRILQLPSAPPTLFYDYVYGDVCSSSVFPIWCSYPCFFRLIGGGGGRITRCNFICFIEYDLHRWHHFIQVSLRGLGARCSATTPHTRIMNVLTKFTCSIYPNTATLAPLTIGN